MRFVSIHRLPAAETRNELFPLAEVDSSWFRLVPVGSRMSVFFIFSSENWKKRTCGKLQNPMTRATSGPSTPPICEAGKAPCGGPAQFQRWKSLFAARYNLKRSQQSALNGETSTRMTVNPREYWQGIYSKSVHIFLDRWLHLVSPMRLSIPILTNCTSVSANS